jgi:hypothetical protein
VVVVVVPNEIDQLRDASCHFLIGSTVDERQETNSLKECLSDFFLLEIDSQNC